MSDNLTLYINKNLLTEKQDFLNAVTYMYNKWPHMIKIFIINTNNSKIELGNIPFKSISYNELPDKINKCDLLFDSNFETLMQWEYLLGKSIAFDLPHEYRCMWEGFFIYPDYTYENFKKLLIQTMHLYD